MNRDHAIHADQIHEKEYFCSKLSKAGLSLVGLGKLHTLITIDALIPLFLLWSDSLSSMRLRFGRSCEIVSQKNTINFIIVI